MGTRADWYIQYVPKLGDATEGPGLRWLGSVCMDGYPDGFDDHLFEPVQDSLFQPGDEIWAEKVTKMIAAHESGRLPDTGWPWPWATSATTDYAYVLYDGRVWASNFGRMLFLVQPDLDSYGEPRDPDDDSEDPDRFKKLNGGLPKWPDMRFRQGPISHGGMIVMTPEGVQKGKV
jgi:hypothetical protein